MSKKKATMTLKDFHGGSIPSDLPLPSAPGVTVRPSDRVGFDRPSAWENPMGRSDHRLRPGSAGAVRNFDDKSPFMTHSTRIGRNFDEDERTPLDGVSGPRRTVSDESFRAPAIVQLEPKSDYLAPNNRPVSNPRSSEGVGTQSFGSNRGNYQNVGGNSGNVWGLKKDVVVQEPGRAPWSAPDAAMKLANASALDKVSSGRWQSKQPANYQVDVEVIRHPEMEIPKGYGMYNRSFHDNIDVAVGRDSHEVAFVRHTERSLTVDDGTQVGSKELPVYERAKSPIYGDGFQPGKIGGSESQAALPPESRERPKLNLIPRSRPLESVESPPVDCKQPYQQPSDPGRVEYVSERHGKVNVLKPGLAGSNSGNQVQERPKLNLKPRSQPLEQMGGNIEPKRNMLFGGARPRELVLKERGIDDVAVNHHDQGHPSNMVKQDVTRAENIPFDNRIGKNIDRRDQRVGPEKPDMQRNWRSENRRSSRDLEKQQQERLPSPETWRKAIIEQPPSPTRHGKAASAVELAQAFSKSVSDPKTADQLSGQRGLPGRGQIPFSRLTGPPHPRPQLNGY